MKEVTSLANPIVKDIKALANKKDRDETRSFIAEGLKLVIDALELGFDHPDARLCQERPRTRPRSSSVATEDGAARRTRSGSQRESARRRSPGATTRRWSSASSNSAGCQPPGPEAAVPAKPMSRSTGSATPATSAPSSARPMRRAPPASSSSARPPIRFRLETGPRHDGLGVRRAAGQARNRCRFPHVAEGCRRVNSPPRTLPALSITAPSTTARNRSFILMGNEQAGLPEELAREADGARPHSTGKAAPIRSIWPSPPASCSSRPAATC